MLLCKALIGRVEDRHMTLVAVSVSRACYFMLMGVADTIGQIWLMSMFCYFDWEVLLAHTL